MPTEEPSLLMTPEPAYVRLAKLVTVHDGDTATLALDHGRYPDSRAVTEAVLRIRDLYSPELSQAGGAEARDYAYTLLSTAGRIVVQTYKASFARTVADVWVDGRSFAELMIAAGHGTAQPQ